MSTEPVTAEDVCTLVLESDQWPEVSIDPPDGDGDFCIDLGHGKCDMCNNTRTWITTANAIALRDWLNKVLP